MADKSNLSPDELKKTSGGANADRSSGANADKARPKLQPVDPVGGPSADMVTDAELASAQGGQGVRATVSGTTSAGKIPGHGTVVGSTDPLHEKELRRASGGAQNADVRRLEADKPNASSADTAGGIEPHSKGAK